MYYQVQNQDEFACNFEGLAMVTEQNISQGNCNFTIQIVASSSSSLTLSLMGSVFVTALLTSLFL
jgi:hypothetical protein